MEDINGKRPWGYYKNINNVIEDSKKCSFRSEFRNKYQGAYNYARKNGLLDSMTWLKPKQVEKGNLSNEPIHCVYVYIDEENKMAYVGATKDIKRRQYAHKSKKDKVWKHFDAVGLDVPKPIILRNNLRPIERQAEERNFSIFYKEHGYILLNKLNLTGVGKGSLGGGYIKWSKDAVYKKAQSFDSIKDFLTIEAGAYDAALKFGMMSPDILPWLYVNRKPNSWWSIKIHVVEEAKKYSTWHDFETNSARAARSARENGWKDELYWLTCPQVSPRYWQNINNIINNTKYITSPTELKKNFSAAYNYVNENNLWHLLPWIKFKTERKGYWQIKSNVMNVAKTCSSRNDFKKHFQTAYYSAIKHGWLEELFPSQEK